MKKSILFIAVPLFGMMLSGCGRNGGSTQSPTAPAPEPTGQVTSVPPPSSGEADKHANSLAITRYGKTVTSFYTRVGVSGETLKGKLDPVPTKDEEKTFTWHTSDPTVVTFEVSEDTSTITLSLLKEGTAVISCTNDWNSTDPNFTKSTTVNVLENSANTYFWQYSSEDLAKFGKDADHENGTASGNANLAGISWHYERQFQNSLRSSTNPSGCLQLGKGEAPDGQVTFTAENSKSVKQVVVETASAQGSASLSLSINEETIFGRKTSGDLDAYDSGLLDPAKSGKIELKWSGSTGAIYIKSIVIIFDNSESGQTNYSFDLTSLASEWSSAYDPRNLDSEDSKVHLSFAGAGYGTIGSKEGLEDKGVIVKEKGFTISVDDSEKVIQSVSVSFLQWERNNDKLSKTVSLYTTYYGPKYFDKSSSLASVTQAANASGKNFSISGQIFGEGINSVLVDTSSNTNQVGILSVDVTTINGTQAVFKDLTLSGTPTKTEYVSGEDFDPSGLQVLANFTDSETFPSYDVLGSVSWGAIDFVAGTCTGTFDGHTVVVNGLTEKSYVAKTYTKVTTEQSDYSGTYIIAVSNSNVILDSSVDDPSSTSNYLEVEDCFDGATLTGSYEIDQAAVVIAKSGDYYTIKASKEGGKYIGCSKGTAASVVLNKDTESEETIKVYPGSISAAKSAGDNYKFSIVLENERLVIKTAGISVTDGRINSAMCMMSSKRFNFATLKYNVVGESPNQTLEYDTTQFKTGTNKFIELYKMN